MKTTEIMKIEYLEPVVRVKEVSRRRCVVASYNDGTSEAENMGVTLYNGYGETDGE